jgi:MerR family mercuric resistance operon transcriptional regulator
MRNMTIGIVARAAGVGVETVRFYERRGLIDQPLKPEASGYRDYPSATVERIRFIRQAQDLGFSLREIAELLALQADPGTDCADVRARAAAKLDDVFAKIERLQRIRGALEELIAACPGRGAVRACSILDALSETRESARKAARQQEVETGWIR